jgi:hypothetical protein
VSHTPGPWAWDTRLTDLEGKPLEALTHAGGSVLVHAAAWPIEEADARLIASAPDLLAALERIAGTSDDPRTHAIGGTEMREVARGAIAKAKGES